MKSKLLSPEDVAERLAVNPATVRSWLRSGKLKGVKLGEKIWRIDEGEVREMLCREEDVNYGAGVTENCLEGVDAADYRGKYKERILNNLDYLSSDSLAVVDSVIQGLKEKETTNDHENRSPAYLRARRALSSIKGSLSDDITRERKEWL